MTRPTCRALLVSALLAEALLSFGCQPNSPAVASKSEAQPSSPVPEPVQPPPPPPILLELRAGTERLETLSGTGRQEFLLPVPVGTFVDLRVDQEGVDVVLELYNPDGTLETRVDSPNGRHGPEPLPVVGSFQNPLRLVVAGGDQAAIMGQYRLKSLLVRPATTRDLDRIGVERAFALAENLRRKRTAEALAEAPRHYHKALADVRTLGDKRREADLLFGWGALSATSEHYDVAAKAFNEALALFVAQRRHREAVACRNRLGTAWLQLGEARKAIPLLESAAKGYGLLGELRDQARTQNSLARGYARIGKIELAVDTLQTALAIFRQLEDPAGEGIALSLLGEIQTDRGLFLRAEDSLSQALDVLKAAKIREHEAPALASLGWIRFLRGQQSEALELMEEAMSMQRQLGGRRDLAVMLHDLGIVLESAGDLRRSEGCFQEASKLFASVGWKEGEAISLANGAHVLLKQDRVEEARASFEAAIGLAPVDSDPLTRSSGHYGLALVLAKQGKLQQAALQMEMALRLYEDLRRESMNPSFRALTFAFQHPTYTFYIDLLMRLAEQNPSGDYERKALEAVERARARSLLDDLLLPPWLLRAQSDDRFHSRENALTAAINRASDTRDHLLARNASDTDLSASSRELRALLGEVDHLEAELRLSHPRFRAQGEARPLDLTELRRQALDGETILLEYSLGVERSFLWAVTENSIESFVLPPRAELESRATALHRCLSSGASPLGRAEMEAHIDWLSEALLGDVGPYLLRRRLLIIPDGDLVLVPFAALPLPRKIDEPWADQRNDSALLGFSHEISYAPSASAVAYLRKRGLNRPADLNELMAIGDPIYHASAAELPYASVEMRALQELFPASRIFSASGLEASKETLQAADLARYRIVHFASHATFDSEFPELSAILLSNLNGIGEPRDGALHSYELRRLHFENDLVVVSGCSTGRGKKLRGEGAVGLVNSLLSAGAQQVLVSLWEVDDRATAELMKHLYRGLIRDGLTIEAALANAQRSISLTPGWEGPYYWAGFLLNGSSRSR